MNTRSRTLARLHRPLPAVYLSFFAFLLVLGATMAQASDDKITVFVAKKIVTMDTTNPQATAVAVRGSRVVGCL